MLPTAQPVVALTKCTDSSNSVVPPLCGVHVLPASVVDRIVPLCPTAQPVVALTKCTDEMSDFGDNHCSSIGTLAGSAIVWIWPPS